jgi:putative ubiquitin-RnfH superfamily antitoxin RatB of RatAB toxin-antitoxin module
MTFAKKPNELMADRMICVELVYAEAEGQTMFRVQLPEDSTVADAIKISGVSQQLALGEPLRNQIGIFGKKVSLDRVLQDGDRMEIYRPLLWNPMEARRRRARHS